MDVKRHNGNVLPKKPWTLVRGFLIFHGYARCATKTGKSPSSNNPASDVRNADALSVNFYLCTINRKLRETLRIVKKKDRDGELLC